MNEKQYERSVKNRRRYSPRALFSGEETGRIVRRAARAAGSRAAAAEAWQYTVPAEFAAVALVDTFLAGCLRVEVSEPAALHALRQRAAVLTRALQTRLPALRELRFDRPRAVRDTQIDAGRPIPEREHA